MTTGGVFSLIASDGKSDRAFAATSFMRAWRWGECVHVGRYSFHVDPEKSWAVACFVRYDEIESATRSYLEILPMDIRRYILLPMCETATCIILRFEVTEQFWYNAGDAGVFAELVRTSGMAYPCTLWQTLMRALD